MNKNIILALVVIVAAVGLWMFASNDEVAVPAVQDSAETQLAPGAETSAASVDTRTVEELIEEEGSAPILEQEVVADEEVLPVADADQELVGDDTVAPEVEPGTASFTVLGSNFAYDLEEIRVKEGDTVTINFRSVDGFHDWVVDEFDAATDKVSTGNETSVTFVADKKGTFEYYCSVGSHRANGMVGNLIVE